ncbi:hypothetical protein F5B19DRAFT_205782 [Rostrohypoxylon terebratum]|nr:hypothetical protein F5B19DRAFT_205782 [Rostrohypoxylon terebratum]
MHPKMRLACICDGEITDINTVIKRDPFHVRSLLLDSLFACFPGLPDSPDFFQAERSIREALLKFQGSQDRYAKSYILTRSFDTRSFDTRAEKTPRANLIPYSFEHGGPLALVGTFYATIDAHRNIRNRETLDYLLNKASDEAKIALMLRANTFPCNPSLTAWLGRILDRIEPDAQGLACILWWLGTNNLPINLFHWARLPSLSWGADGEVVEIPARLVSVIKGEEKLNTAIRNLEFIGFIKLCPTAIEFNPRIADLLQDRLRAGMWFPRAAKVVLHALPKYASLQPASYSQRCQELLPSVVRILGHLDGQRALLEQMDLVEVVEACLSVSHFGDKSWKMNALSIATQAITICKDNVPERPLLQARVCIRKYFLSVLYPEDRNVQDDNVTIPAIDRRSNAFAALLAIFRARKSIQLNQLPSALKQLDGFDCQEVTSTFETIRAHQVALMRARILRFGGDFHQAYHILQALPHCDTVVIMLSTVLCELDRCDEAIQLLQELIATTVRTTSTSRAKLTLAHAHLLKCMYTLLQGKPVCQTSLGMSKEIYEELRLHCHPESYFEKMDYLSVLMGRAMVRHMDGCVDAALEAWNGALATSTGWVPTGYTDMIISYSMSELEARRGNQILADILAGHTRNLFPQTGRQHHFPGLGSLWPNIVGGWLSGQGRDAIVSIQGQ